LLAASAALVFPAPAHSTNVNDIIGFCAPVPACLDGHLQPRWNRHRDRHLGLS
jgi:hypothetical protein